MARNFRLYPSGCFVLFFNHLFPPECELCLWLCSTWQINSRIYWISLIHHQALILQSYLVLWYLLFNENITPMFMIEKIKFTEVIQQSLCDAVKEKHWWWDFSIRKYWTSVGGFFCELLQQRGPHMGDAWEPFLFRSADPGRVLFFLEGIPPAWLLWYRLAGCIYIHTVTRQPEPTAEKEADLFATEVSLQNWNKLMRLDLHLSRC